MSLTQNSKNNVRKNTYTYDTHLDQRFPKRISAGPLKDSRTDPLIKKKINITIINNNFIDFFLN